MLVAMPWRICLGEGGSVSGLSVCAVASHCGVQRIPDWAEFAEEVEEFFGADGVAEVLDKERSRGSVSRVFCRAKIGGGIAVETDLFTSGASLEFLLIAWLVFVGLVDCVW